MALLKRSQNDIASDSFAFVILSEAKNLAQGNLRERGNLTRSVTLSRAKGLRRIRYEILRFANATFRMTLRPDCGACPERMRLLRLRLAMTRAGGQKHRVSTKPHRFI